MPHTQSMTFPAQRRMAAHLQFLLRVAVSLLLALCTLPAVDGFGPNTEQQLAQRPGATHVAVAVRGSALESADLIQRHDARSSDRTFLNALLPGRTAPASSGAPVAPSSEAADRRARIRPDGPTAARAPPLSIA